MASTMAAKMSDSRNGLVDIVRLIAVFEIVVFHVDVSRGRLLLGLGLPALLILTNTFSVGPSSTTFEVYTFSRAKRLLLPWVAWGILYGLMMVAQNLVAGRPVLRGFSPNMIMYGTSPHLWFLPFAFVANLATWAVWKVVCRWPTWLLCGISFPASVVLLLWARSASDRLGLYPTDQWLFGLASVPIGLAFGRLRHIRVRWTVPVGVLLLCFAFVHRLTTGPGFLVQYEAAVALLLICFGTKMRSTQRTRQAGSLALSVYLVHAVAIAGFRYTPLDYAPATIGVVLTSVLISVLLRKITPLRGIAYS